MTSVQLNSVSLKNPCVHTIERIQIKPSLRLAFPKPQVVRRCRVVPRNHDVVRDSKHLLAAVPHRAARAVDQAVRASVEADVVSDVETRELPGVLVVEPRIGRLIASQ